MWRGKKFIVVAVLAAMVVAGSIGGIALAADDGDASQPKTLLARVAEKLGIDQQELEDTFAEAQGEMRDEALDSYLQKLVGNGKITEEEAGQYKTWLQAKPDVPVGFGFKGHDGLRGMGGMRGFGGMHGMQGMKGMRGFDGTCAPVE